MASKPGLRKVLLLPLLAIAWFFAGDAGDESADGFL